MKSTISPCNGKDEEQPSVINESESCNGKDEEQPSVINESELDEVSTSNCMQLASIGHAISKNRVIQSTKIFQA
jgi:hypothetical protein